MTKKLFAKKVALLALLTACALIVFTLESLFSPIPIPGAKLGLSHVFTLIAIIVLGGHEGMILVILKSVLGCLIIGNIGALMYSLPAGIISCAVSIILLKEKKNLFSVTAISTFSACVSNAVQNIVFCLVVKSFSMISYLPYLIILGIISGFSVGIIVTLIVKKTPSSAFRKIIDG